MDHEDAYDMTTYDEEMVINGDDDRIDWCHIWGLTVEIIIRKRNKGKKKQQ